MLKTYDSIDFKQSQAPNPFYLPLRCNPHLSPHHCATISDTAAPQIQAAWDIGLRKSDFYGCSIEQQNALETNFGDIKNLLREAAESVHFFFVLITEHRPQDRYIETLII